MISKTAPPGAIDAARAPPAAPAVLTSIPLLTAVGLLVSVWLTLPVISRLMLTGLFVDPDDAMRMAQARDLMNGQGWFDLTAWRMDPPQGVLMHWTRIVDAPIALLTWLFQLFTDPEPAQRLTQLSFPLLLYAGLLVLSAYMARRLVGAFGPLLAVLLTVLGGAIHGYFAPGRLDHDHAVILLLLAMAACLIEAMAPNRPRAAVLAGVAASAGLAVSLEGLPYIVLGIAALPIAWVILGAAMQTNLRAFALGLGASLIVAFVVTVAPSRYLNGACDMLSAAHLAPGLVGAALCVALAALSPRLPSIPLRLVAAGAAGALTLACLAMAYPACFADPLAKVDPVLREHWLSQVSEARPLLETLQRLPALAQLVVAPILIGLTGIALAAMFERGVARARWLVLLALTLAGCAATFWQIRAAGVTAPLALFGSVWIAARIGAWIARARPTALPIAVVAALPQTPLFLAPFASSAAPLVEHGVVEKNFGCWEANAFSAFASMPQGAILAPIDTGAHLLARTRHGVIAAQFHRNEHGNLVAINAFRADPAQAETIASTAGARYVVFCPNIGDMEYYRDIAPEGLAAHLLRNDIPTWLKQLPLDTPYKVFELSGK